MFFLICKWQEVVDLQHELFATKEDPGEVQRIAIRTFATTASF